jgi:hypothetical protein
MKYKEVYSGHESEMSLKSKNAVISLVMIVASTLALAGLSNINNRSGFVAVIFRRGGLARDR